MARFELQEQFKAKQREIALGDRALVAIAAHVEVRSVLRASAELQAHGLDDILIGSYARRVSIWPGKDVDVLGRLMRDSVGSLHPDSAYAMFGRALTRFEREGRLTPQPRSFKIDYSPQHTPDPTYIRAAAEEYSWRPERVKRVLSNLRGIAFEFSVDVVPAVPWDEHYAIPETSRDAVTGERRRTGQWRRTSPVKLTEETQTRNRHPRIAGVGAFVRTVRAVKQIKAHHLPDAKPSSLYYEFILHEGFKSEQITGDSWADLRESALTYIAARLATAATNPVVDPILREPYSPAPSAADLSVAAAVFGDQARAARRAVTAETRCQAAIEWRQVFGGNARSENVFPLPPGCRGTGAVMGAAAANVAAGGTAERSFGDR